MVGGARLTGGGSGADDSIFFVGAQASFKGLMFTNSNSEHAIYQRDSGGNGYIERCIFDSILYPISINNSGGTSGMFNVAHATISNAIHGVSINDGGTISVVNSILANVTNAYVIHNGILISPSHNLLFNVGQVGSGSPIDVDPAQLFGDPLFVNSSTLDFRLSPGSLAIDSGLNIGLPFSGLGPDRGVFEFNAVPEPNVFAILFCALVHAFSIRRGRGNVPDELS